MILAVASGKGGTGKTTMAVGLALAAAGTEHGPVLLLDCDVEAPDAALLLLPALSRERDAAVPVPSVEEERCNRCGRCAEVCAFRAIAVAGGKILVFPELCHGCGCCLLECPEAAIRERPFRLGKLEAGRADGIDFAHGRLQVGRAVATPVIRQLKRWMLQDPVTGTVVLDGPPGSACPLVETVRGADFALLVTEPTPFGLHDLAQAVAVVRDALSIPCGVVVNRDEAGGPAIDDYCDREGVPVLLRVPFARRIAEAYSNGIPIVEALPEYRPAFRRMLGEIRSRVAV